MCSRTATRRRRSFSRLICRCLAVLVMTAIGAGWGAFRYWTDPVTVRRLVLDQMRRQFPGAEVTLDSARLWPGWGIRLTNLTVARKDDPGLTPVLQIPTARIEHDSEELSKGRLRVRRLKLERPRITAIRGPAGQWNLDGLLAPPKPGVLLPIIVVERGTLVLRIAPARGDESVWEVGDVRAALFETPGSAARFEAKGASARLGSLSIEGVWQRATGQVDSAFDVSGMPVSVDLIRDLARFAPLPIELIRHVHGEGRVHLTAHRRPSETPTWQTEWRLSMSRGQLGLRDLPIDVTDIELHAQLRDGRIMVKEVHGLAADAPVHAMLEASLPAAEPMEAVDAAAVSIEHLLITPELFARLPEAARKFQQKFAPVGRLSLVYRFAKRVSGGWDARVELRPEDLVARYHKFPYAVRRVRGTVTTDLSSDGPGRHHFDLSAEVNGGSRFALRGQVAGEEPFPAIDLWITGPDGKTPAREVPVDDDMIAALPIRFQPLARSFHFQGRCDVLARIHHAEGCPLGHDQYHLRCRDATICYEPFPVPLENAAAELAIHLGPGLPGDPNEGDHWALKNGTATHRGAAVTVKAHNESIAHGQRIHIEMAGTSVPLGEPIAKAVAVHRLGPTWEMLQPEGRIDFSSRVTLTDQPGGMKVPSVTLALRGAAIRPGFFPLAMTDVAAHVHSDPGRVLLGECTARHGAARFSFGGGEIRTGQGLWVDVRELRVHRLQPDADFVAALPPLLQRAANSLRPQGAMDVHVKRLVLDDPPDIPGPPKPPMLYWDGALGVQDFTVTPGVTWTKVGGTFACRGAVRGNRLEWLAGNMALNSATILRQPIERLNSQFVVETETPDVLQIRGVHGRIFGGQLAGEGRIAFGGGLDYSLDIKALGIRLEEFGQHNGFGAGKLEGPATAQFYLTGRGAGLAELSGRGDIDVPNGKLYDLPLALELLKAVSLRAPDGVAFDEAHAAVRFEGQRLRVERLDLLGNAVSLGGRGALNLDGTDVDLDFYAVWARIAQVLPVGWRDVPPWLSQQLLKIKMRGSLEHPSFAPEPVPFLVEPVQSLLERVKSRMSPTKQENP